MTPTDDTLPPLPEPRDLDGARWGYDADDMRNYAVDAYVAAVAQERERCARVCETLAEGARDNSAPGAPYWDDAAAEIRASCAPSATPPAAPQA